MTSTQKSPNWLRNSWYQAGWADEVTAATPLVRTILGEPILFFRKADGSLAALFDRCPHRFAPLSAGKIDGDRVTCGYHGLSFFSDGSCAANPHGPIRPRMRVAAYPVAERHTAIWIWMGDTALADESQIPDLTFIDETPKQARITMSMPTKANYQLIVDNILDLSHADYLHPDSLGGMMVASEAFCHADGDKVVAEWIAMNCTPPAAMAARIAPAKKADIWIEVTWQAPALMVLCTTTKPAGVARTADVDSNTLHNMVPESETSTHYFMCSTRRFRLDDPEFIAKMAKTLEHAFKQEDKPMLEKQQARMGTPDLWSLHPIVLKSDKAAVFARRKLDTLIAAEQAEQETP